MSHRRSLLAKVHIAKKQLGLDEDTYRAALRVATGKESAGACNLRELSDAIAAFRAKGFQDRPAGGSKRAPAQAKAPGGKLADTPHAAKLRALWLSAYHLGIVRDPAESALGAFIKRQTGIDAMRWLPPEDAANAIEALKDWMAREAGIEWPKSRASAKAHRLAVIEAQWFRLIALKAVQIASLHALDPYIGRILDWPSVRIREAMTDREADEVIRALGDKIRKRIAQQAQTAAAK